MTSLARALVFGAGGHAHVVIDTLLQAAMVTPIAILTPDSVLWGQAVFDVPIIGNDDMLDAVVSEYQINCFVVGVGSTRSTALRRQLFERGLSAGLEATNVIHPSALISPRARYGAGVQLMPGSIVNAAATIGDNVCVNSGAIIEHDCWIGDHVHIATGAKLAGHIRVETGAHIGIGAVIRQGIIIGAEAVIGAGAVVVSNVAAGTVVIGVPAKPLNKG